MLTVSLLFLVGPQWVVSFFTTDPIVMNYAVDALRIISAGYVFYGIGMVMLNAFNGAGDAWTPTWINLAGFWAFQIPFAYLMAKAFGLGPTGVFIAIPAAEVAMTVAAIVLFRKGRWKLVKI